MQRIPMTPIHALCRRLALLALLACLSIPTPAAAQSDSRDVMVVFDGSGSMWGQIDGRAKIEIARDALSTVLSETTPDMRLGMIGYGHRRKGDCADIEELVPMSAATDSVPQMISAARTMNPKGMTPLSDAVLRAAQALRFTESAATVVLLTDGLETCDADPCALGQMLERDGIDFTAHVIGFGLSAEEGRQVQCLADATGGLYLQADTSDQLGLALTRTLAEPPAYSSAPPPAEPPAANVRFEIRDTQDSPLLGIREIGGFVQTTSGDEVPDAGLEFFYLENVDHSAAARLEPGDYVMVLQPVGTDEQVYSVGFTVGPEPDQTIALTYGGWLDVTVMLNPEQAYDYAAPPLAAVNEKAYVYLGLFPLEDGGAGASALFETPAEVSQAVPPGTYLLRGTLDRTLTAEQVIEVTPGRRTQVTFSFDATPVTLQALDPDGEPVAYQTTYLYDGYPSGNGYWRKGWGGTLDGTPARPFWLPRGTWGIDLGQEGGGAARSQIAVSVPGDYRPIQLDVRAGQRLPDTAKSAFATQRCAAIIGVGHNGCLLDPAAKPADGAPVGMLTAAPQPTAGGPGYDPSDLQPIAQPKSPAPARAHGTVPVGIFALLPDAPVDPTQARETCRRSPVIGLPDGRQVYRFESVTGYKTTGFADCVAGADTSMSCQLYEGAPDSSDPVGSPLALDLSATGDGLPRLCDRAAGRCQVLYACIGRDRTGLLSETLAGGAPRVPAILDWDPAGAGFRYDQSGKVVLP